MNFAYAGCTSARCKLDLSGFWTLRAARWIVVLGLIGSLLGCGATPRILGDGGVLQHVNFVGAKQLSHKRLLRHLHAGETRWVPATPNIPHDPALVAVDARRLESLYHAEGFLQARVVGTRTERDGTDVTLTFKITEGRPTLVGGINVRWQAVAQISSRLRKRVTRASTLRARRRFSKGQLNTSIGSLRAVLQNAGYPLARVVGSADIHPGTRRAAVTFEVFPGQRARIGRIRFVGRQRVPLQLMQREVAFVHGARYSPRRMRQIEQALKAMRVFRWVAVEAPRHLNNGRVDITVRVSEADPQRIKLGGALFFDTARWQQQASAQYTHTNVDGQLTRLQIRAIAGWAELPDPFNPLLHGPVVAFSPSLSRKGLLEDHLHWSLRPSYQLNLREGYQYHAPSNTLSVARWFLGSTKLSLAHTIRYVDFFNVSPALAAGATILGKDFRDPFLLSTIQLRAQHFAANSITRPTNGVILDGRYILSSGAIGSTYDFHELRTSARAYWRPTGRLQFAARAKLGLIVPFGSAQAGSPLSYRYYLGGATTVRGWGSRRLSPRVRTCDDNGVCTETPVGGQSVVQLNVEARLHLWWRLDLVAFCDAGDVQGEALRITPSLWHVTAGPGLRAKTPLGKFRLDFGYRIVRPGTYADERAWGLHFGLGETF